MGWQYCTTESPVWGVFFSRPKGQVAPQSTSSDAGFCAAEATQKDQFFLGKRTSQKGGCAGRVAARVY